LPRVHEMLCVFTLEINRRTAADRKRPTSLQRHWLSISTSQTPTVCTLSSVNDHRLQRTSSDHSTQVAHRFSQRQFSSPQAYFFHPFLLLLCYKHTKNCLWQQYYLHVTRNRTKSDSNKVKYDNFCIYKKYSTYKQRQWLLTGVAAVVLRDTKFTKKRYGCPRTQISTRKASYRWQTRPRDACETMLV